MSNPSWPSGLPQYVLESGYDETVQDQTVESPMETGPAKIRRRFTKSIETYSVAVMMTQAQSETFRTFWQSTCAGGSKPFDWVLPRQRTNATFRFRNPAPKYMPSGGAVVVSFKMERL